MAFFNLPSAEMDDRLHADRLRPDRSKRTFLATLDDLPDGVVVQQRFTGGATQTESSPEELAGDAEGDGLPFDVGQNGQGVAGEVVLGLTIEKADV